MNILITGAAGMTGRKLAERLARDGALGGKAISTLTLYDVAEAVVPSGAKVPVKIATGDLAASGEADRLVGGRPEAVFHLAAVVSGEAEQDFEKGYRVNWTARACSWRRCGRRATGRVSSSPAPSRCSARRFPTSSATTCQTAWRCRRRCGCAR